MSFISRVLAPVALTAVLAREAHAAPASTESPANSNIPGYVVGAAGVLAGLGYGWSKAKQFAAKGAALEMARQSLASERNTFEQSKTADQAALQGERTKFEAERSAFEQARSATYQAARDKFLAQVETILRDSEPTATYEPGLMNEIQKSDASSWAGKEIEIDGHTFVIDPNDDATIKTLRTLGYVAIDPNSINQKIRHGDKIRLALTSGSVQGLFYGLTRVPISDSYQGTEYGTAIVVQVQNKFGTAGTHTIRLSDLTAIFHKPSAQ